MRGTDYAYPESHAEKIFEALGTGVCLASNVTTRGEEEVPTRDRYREYLLLRLPAGARYGWCLRTTSPP